MIKLSCNSFQLLLTVTYVHGKMNFKLEDLDFHQNIFRNDLFRTFARSWVSETDGHLW